MSYIPQDSEIERFMRESNFIENERIVANPCDSAFEPWIIGDLHENDIEGAGFFLANELTIENLKKTHKILFKGTGEKWGIQESKWVGVWKPIANMVGNHTPPPPERIGEIMKEYFAELPNMDAFEAHNEFANIHPFLDGNGRMARLIWWWKSLDKESHHESLTFLHNYYYETLNHQNSRSKFQ